MEWALAGIAGLVVFLYGRSHNWWSGAATPALPPKPAPIVCDIETDMPDSLKQAVLAQIASQKDPATLVAFAKTLTEANFIQSAYCLDQRAWVLGGSKGAAPAPPTSAQIAAAQAARAAQASNLGQPNTLGQIQVAPGTPNLNINVGTMIGVVGATPYDATTNPTGYTVDVDATVATKMGEGVYAITAPGTITFNWSPISSTKLTATGASAASAVAAAAKPNPPSISTSSIPGAPAVAASVPPTVPGLDPNTVAAAAAQVAAATAPPATQSAGFMVDPQGGIGTRQEMQ